jgi:PIN domain nuclease of toxin-antitoxin system
VPAIRTSHIISLAKLPDLHKDPFDRILVAQALAEGLTLASKDAALARYSARLVWGLSLCGVSADFLPPGA